MEPIEELHAIRRDVAQIKATLASLLPVLDEAFGDVDDKLELLGVGVTALERGPVTVNVNTFEPFTMPGLDGDDADEPEEDDVSKFLPEEA